MTMGIEMTSKELQERIKKFILDIIRLVKKLPKTIENLIFIKQIIRSASSIGANYAEAICAQTRQEFLHKINLCRSEANETVYWLDLILAVNPQLQEEINALIIEGGEILKIFISSVKTTQIGTKNHK